MEEGCSRADLAYRWIACNSALNPERGDGVVVGASRLQKLEQTLQGLGTGPLKEESVKKIDELWEGIESEALLDKISR